MFRRPRRPTPPPEPPREVTALEFLGARLMPDMSGWWVYALCDRGDGHVFYGGQTNNWWSRLRDHVYAFRDQIDLARIWAVPCEDQAEADLFELLLIRKYDPERNTVGRRGELEARLRKANRPFKAGFPRWDREPLDSRKENA